MKQLKFVFTPTLLFFMVTNSCSQKNSTRSSSVLGIFVASTPCSQGTKPLPGIPVNADCELIKWNLTLYQDESKKTPTTYKLHCVYGLPKQGTTGFIGGGNKVDIEGKWTIIKGPSSNPNAIVYRLNDNKSNKTISLLKLNDDLLHLLDSDQRLMIGSAAWSYTLNRLDNK
jgi:NlpE N-terminal domain